MSELLPNDAPIQAIPLTLREREPWIRWRLDLKEEKAEELTKVPYTDIDRKAKTNKPLTWLTFAEALRRWVGAFYRESSIRVRVPTFAHVRQIGDTMALRFWSGGVA